MKAFKAATDAAAASGQKIPAGVGASFKAMQADLDSSTAKLGRLRDQMGDVKTRADAMGQGFAQAAASGGSLTSMLGNLEASGGGAAKALSNISLGVVGIAAAFKVGYEAGKAFVELMKTLGVDVQVTGKAWAGFAGLLAKITSDPNHKKWLEDLSHSTENYNKLLEPIQRGLSAVTLAHQALTKEISAQDKVLKALGIEWHKAGTAAGKVAAEVDAMAKRIESATKSGESFRDIAKDNATALDALQKKVDEGRVSWNSLSVSLQNALVANREMLPPVNTLTGGLQSLTAANNAYKQSLIEAEVAQRAMTAAIAADKAAFDAHTESINAAAAAAHTATDTMETLGSGMEAAAGSSATMTTSLTLVKGVFFEVAAATEAQNKALEDLLRTQNAYGAAIEKTLDIAKGWKDYLAGLADAYRTGAIDLLQYKNRLAEFQTQLQMMFSGATGEARKAIEAMTSAIQTLINTAGGGPATPSGSWQNPTQQLNQTFNNP